MNNSRLLRAKIAYSGYKIRFIADYLGLTPQGLANKIKDITRFRANEIALVCHLLEISEGERTAIFFGPYVAERVIKERLSL